MATTDERDEDELSEHTTVHTSPAIAETPTLSSRYGRTRRLRLRDRWFLAGGALVLVLATGAWGVWSNWGQDSQSDVLATTSGFTIPDSYHVTISFTISAPSHTPVTCALEAMNVDYTIVGWKIEEFPPSPNETTAYTRTLLTTQKSTTGLINTCWLT